MIALAEDCLLFKLESGESIPFSADMISVELMGETARWLDVEMVQQAAQAVFHYFKRELARPSITVDEFAQALEKVLRELRFGARTGDQSPHAQSMCETDLRRLALESLAGGELFFFPRLRRELRRHLAQPSRVVHFRGLRGCVKQLAGARRWTPRCRELEERIVCFLRQCLRAEAGRNEFALVVQ